MRKNAPTEIRLDDLSDNPPADSVVPPLMQPEAPARTPLGRLITLALGLLVSVVVTLALLFGDFDRLTIGALSLLLMIGIMVLGIPIGLAMIMASVVGLIALADFDVASASTTVVLYSSVASWSMSVVPLFILMGFAVWRGGLARRAFYAAQMLIGRVPGGLAVASTVAGAGLAASSGSTIGITYALGRMAVPEMLRAGYKPTLATGSVAMAGTLGQVIPPSILLVVFASVAEVPVGGQLLAGVIPGIALAAAFCLTVGIWCLVDRQVAPRVRMSGVSGAERWRALGGVMPLIVIVLIVIGGMVAGLFTATEAAAFGAFAALVFGWWGLGRGNRGWRATWDFVRQSLLGTVSATAAIFLVLVGALMLTRLLALSGLTQKATAWLVSLELNRIELLLALIVFYILLGMVLESLPMILLTVPLLMAPLEAVGVDMIWFGVFLVIMCEIGMVFPPIGLLTFIVHRLVQDPELNLGHRISLGDVFKGILPFCAAAVGVTMILIWWPDIVLWLPRLAAP